MIQYSLSAKKKNPQPANKLVEYDKYDFYYVAINARNKED